MFTVFVEPMESPANNELIFSLQQQIATIRLESDSTKLQLQQAEIARTAIMVSYIAISLWFIPSNF